MGSILLDNDVLLMVIAISTAGVVALGTAIALVIVSCGKTADDSLHGGGDDEAGC